MNVDPLQVLSKLAAVYNIPACRVTPPFAGLENFDYGLRKALDPEFDWQEFGYTLLKHTPEQTLLIAEGTFELKFALFRVPDEKDTVFMIGPWTDGPRSEDSRRWAQKNLGKAGDEAVQEYYNGVHTLSGDDFATAIYAVVSVMLGQEELRTQEVKEFLPFMFQPDIRYFTEPTFERDIPVAMIEQRYQIENEMLEAVTQGDENAAILSIHKFGRFSLGDRFIGTLYREKSQFIIMNTLLRKAIEQNAVHPFYVDKISSSYARRIETLDTVEDVQATLQQMLRDLLCLRPPLLPERLLPYGAEGDQPYQSESLGAAHPEKPCGAVPHQPVVSFLPVQAGDRQYPDRLYQHPAGQTCRTAADHHRPLHLRGGGRNGHSGRKLLCQNF